MGLPAMDTKPENMAASRKKAITVPRPVIQRAADIFTSIPPLTVSSSPSQAASCLFALK